ncbi:MAG: hypothetical protein GY915_01770 [bacterium]|nr:hypothetical protein [bacterium]
MKYLRAKYAHVLVMLFLVSGCEIAKHANFHDPSLETRQESYEEQLTKAREYKMLQRQRRRQLFAPKPAHPIPASMKTPITLTLTEDVPVKDALLALAQQAKVNITLSPDIQGSVLLQAHERPFLKVVKEICKTANLRYKIQKKGLRIEADTPYLKNYNLPFLSLARENKTRISIATDVFAASGASSNKSISDVDNGSNTLLTGHSATDCWSELESSLHVILAHTSNQGSDMSGTYTIHKQAGLISIFANQKQHKQIQQYLTLLKRNTSTQVLVEAKIVEVSLSDQYQSGINWHSTAGDLVLNAPFGGTSIITPGTFNAAAAPTRNVFSVGSSGKSLTSIAGFLSQFGTVRTLSSPRLTVMNNQSAVLKVATNEVFFRIDYTREAGNDDRRDVERASSQIQTVPIGLVMVVHPSINPETGQITMTLRPTISRVTGTKKDPAVAFISEQTQESLIPEVQVRELDTVLKIDSGEVIVLGGLMEERADNTRNGVPGGQEMGFLDVLFGGKEDKRSVNELVILLRATIIEDDNIESTLNPADKDLCKSR